MINQGGRVMKSSKIFLLCGLLALTACGKEPQVSHSVKPSSQEVPVGEEPAEEVVPPRTLTLSATLPTQDAEESSDASSKVTVSTSGKLSWSAGDSFALYDTDGGKIQMTLYSGAGTGSAVFVGEIPAGKELDLDEAAIFPYDFAGDPGQIVIPEFRPWVENGPVPVVMAASLSETENDGVIHITMSSFRHVMAVLEFTLQDIPAYARALKLWSKTGAQLSGTYTLSAGLDDVECPDPAERTNTQQTVYFPCKTGYGAESSIKCYIAIPSYAYTDLAFRVIDGDESVIPGTGRTIPIAYAQLNAGDYVSMPAVNVRSAVGSARDNFVAVQGVKWAKGNLRAWKSGTSGSGWQDGWNVYDEQWKSQYVLLNDNVGGGSVSFTLNASKYKEGNTYTHWDYFSWGTVARASRVHNTPITSTNAGGVEFDICGRVFSGATGDVSQMTELTGDDRFADTGGFDTNPSICGDVAFWASKGQWRLPRASEWMKLYSKNYTGNGRAHMQAGYYMAGSKKINGLFFTSCASWEQTSYNTTAVELTDADLESGLFLPKIGERTTNENPNKYDSVSIGYFNAWGVYWTGTYGGLNEGYTDCARHITFRTANDMTYGYTDKMSNTITGQTILGNAIRPVLVE